MKKIQVSLFSLLMFTVSVCAHAQVSPSAYRGKMSLTAGGFASGFQPDYAGGGVPGTSPYRLYGFGAYADLRMTRWISVEAEMRWLRENSFVGITQDTYLFGPRVPIHEYKRLGAVPYGKALVGLGKMDFEYKEAYGRFTDVALGGGVDLNLSKRWSVRAFDFEYQFWPNWINGTLQPYGASAGVAYRIF
jgi:hypothetical protein